MALRVVFRWGLPVLLGVALSCAAGCSDPDSPEVVIGEQPDTAPEVPVEPAPVSIRRLTQAQYSNIVQDLFGETILAPVALEPDITSDGLIAIGASLSTISPRGVELYEEASYDLAEQAMSDPEVRAQIVSCTPTATVDAGCAASFVEDFGRLAWRRPLEDEEVERLVELAGNAAQVRGDFHLGLEFAIAAILQSPSFLYRVELGEEGPDGARRYTNHELATRLSFLLWNTAPDAALLDAADSGVLVTDDGLAEQARRMMDDPRARRGVRAFFTDLFELHKLDALSKDPTIFTHASSEVGPSAREETLLGLEHLIFEEDGDWRDIVTTRRTFLNRKLASMYEVPAPAREGFAQTDLPEDGVRRGLMGHASLLALHAHPVSSSATLRGMFIREVLLCQEIPAPPANVDTSIPEPTGNTPTLRDRVQEHLTNPACTSCHLLTDPIGLALEHYDGLGRFRLYDNGHLIDPSGELDGLPFEDSRDLAELIREHENLGPCLVRHLLRYANGRTEASGEQAAIKGLSEFFEERGHRFQAMLFALVMSPAFRTAGEVEP